MGGDDRGRRSGGRSSHRRETQRARGVGRPPQTQGDEAGSSGGRRGGEGAAAVAASRAPPVGQPPAWAWGTRSKSAAWLFQFGVPLVFPNEPDGTSNERASLVIWEAASLLTWPREVDPANGRL